MFEGIKSTSTATPEGDVHTEISLGAYTMFFIACEDGYVGFLGYQEFVDLFNSTDGNVRIEEEEQDYTTYEGE